MYLCIRKQLQRVTQKIKSYFSDSLCAIQCLAHMTPQHLSMYVMSVELWRTRQLLT